MLILIMPKQFTSFIHDIKDKRLFKIVLFGLPETSTEEITEELKTKFNVVAVNKYKSN